MREREREEREKMNRYMLEIAYIQYNVIVCVGIQFITYHHERNLLRTQIR